MALPLGKVMVWRAAYGGRATMVTGKQYRFNNDCDCLSTTGQLVRIPAGIWPVAELDDVVVLADGREFNLNGSAFQQLKLERKAIPVK